MRRWIAGLFIGSLAGFAVSVVVATGSMGCGKSSSGTGGDGGGNGATCQIAGGTTCQTNGDCPTTANFKCDPNSYCCQFFCQSPADCGGKYDPGDSCKTSALGCICDQGVCKSKQCSSDGECGSTQVCKGGNCQVPDAASSAATVVVEPNPAVAHVGAAAQFTATVLDSKGGPVILAAGSITWTVSNCASCIDATGKFTPTTASAAVGDATVTATVTGTQVSGTAAVTVFASPAASTAQLTVIDGQTNVPVTDATVAFTSATGALVGTAVIQNVMGSYPLPATPPAGAVMLNVFEPNYQYVSLYLGTPAAYPASSGDLVVFLAQNVVGVDAGTVLGGYTGDFSQEPGILDPNSGEPPSAKGDIHVGIAGTAVPQDLLDISLSALLGPTHDVTIQLDGSHNAPLPQGVELGYGTQGFQCRYDGLGAAGGCGLCSGGSGTACVNPTDHETDPTQADWANSVFACGTRSAWGLGGSVPLSALSSQLSQIASGGINVGSLLSALLPQFSSFNSGVFFQVPYTEQPPVPADQVNDACTGKPYGDTKPIPNPANLNSSVPLSLDTPLALQTNVTLPALPAVSGKCQTTALVLAGAIEPGYGLLPLGLSAGTILDANNNPSATCVTLDSAGTANGKVVMSLAPEHGGVERDNYGVVALSLDVSGISGGSSGGVTAISGLVTTAAKLPYNSSVTFPAGSFPPYAQAASYDPNARAYVNDTTTAGVSSASWMRLRFQDAQQREWITYFPTGTAGFTLPAAAAITCTGCTDRSGSGTEAQLVLTAPSTTFGTFFDFSAGAQAQDLIENMTGFSTVGICAPGKTSC